MVWVRIEVSIIPVQPLLQLISVASVNNGIKFFVIAELVDYSKLVFRVEALKICE